MKYITRLSRLIRINVILVRYNVDEIIFATPWFYPLRFFSYLNPWYWLSYKKLSRGVRLRLALENLGPIFIKAGQVLSTRRDLLPEDIADELAKLQDNVPPFDGTIAQKIIEKSLGQKITDIFNDFDIKALASASVAQVHTATLLNGKSVVIKVLRPHIKKIIDRDLDLLATLASLADRYSKEGRKFKPKEIVDEISHTLYDELDLMREAANASQLRRNFLHSSQLYIPEIYWSHCRQNVLVMERIEGIPVHNISALRSAGFNMKKLAETGVALFFTQVFRDSFFHADMHPGNIFVSCKDLENPQYIAVDFGIVGSLSTKDQRYLAENLLAFFKRDYQRVAELHVSSGWLPPDTRIDQFEGAIRAVCEPIFERPLKEISFGHLLLRLFQTARRFNINIQPQLILLQKTLLSIEGVGRQLYPELDLWTTAAPFLEKWIKRQVGPKAFLRRIKDNLPYWSEKLPEIPNLIFDVLSEAHIHQEERRFAKIFHHASSHKKSKVRVFIVGLISGLLAGGLIFFMSGVAMSDTNNSKFSQFNKQERLKNLNEEQYKVTQKEGTEPPFHNTYWDNKEPGIYVDVVSGEPLFSSTDKFDSGTGWPSFSKPIDQHYIITKTDSSLPFQSRTEVKSKNADSHLGHVFDDGPAPSGKRYCINSASLRFIPASKLKEEGYGEYEYLFKNKLK